MLRVWRVVDIDLTPYRLPKPPLWRGTWAIPGGMILLSLLMFLVVAVGARGVLLVILIVALVLVLGFALVAIFVLLPRMMRQRMSSSVPGRKVAFPAAGAPGRHPAPLRSAAGRDSGHAGEPAGRGPAAPLGRRGGKGREGGAAFGGAGCTPRPMWAGAGGVVVIYLLLLAALHIGGALPTALMMVCVFWMLTRYRRVLAKDAATTVRDDPRPPVLFAALLQGTTPSVCAE